MNSVPEFGTVGDLDAAAKLMRASWGENGEQTIDYSPELLASYVDSTMPDEVLKPALYLEGKLAAFVFGFPRRVWLCGESRKLLLMSFFTVAASLKGRGFGRDIWARCLRLACSEGFDGVIHYCVHGNTSNRVTIKSALSEGFCCQQVFTVRYRMRALSRSLDEKRDDDPSSASLAARYLVHSSAFLRHRVPLVRQLTRAEAQWQCTGRAGASTSIRQEDGKMGLITSYSAKIAAGANLSCLFLEDILWDELSPEGRRKLLAATMDAAPASAKLVVAPLLGYSDATTLEQAGFRRSTRVLNAYLTSLNRSLRDVSEMPAIYMDVF